MTTKNGNAVIVSEATWNSLMETLYILSDPEILTSIEEAESEYPDGCVEWREYLKDTERFCRSGLRRISWSLSGRVIARKYVVQRMEEDPFHPPMRSSP